MNGEGGFLTAAALQSRWRSLTPAELADAEDLLAAAGRWIRTNYLATHGTAIAEDNPAAIAVSVSVVKTAITTGAYRGHLSYGRAEGPRSKSGSFSDPGGALVFDDWHKDQLGIPTRPQPTWRMDCNGYDDARY